jgi:predicted MPP superfamily phosphohydrolase
LTEESDFSTRKSFPGLSGNSFDVALHGGERVSSIPLIVFIGVLALIAVAAGFGHFSKSLVLFGFFMGDTLLLALLPRFHISFGPYKPPVLVLAVMRSCIAFLPFTLPWTVVIQVLGTLLIVYGFYLEPHRLKVTHQVYTTSKLPAGSKIRVLHLGDIHVERMTKREKKLNELIRQIQPDLILFSGDVLNLSYLHDSQSWADARQVISEWKAPLGVFMVTGSPAVDLPEIMPDLSKNLTVRWLYNEDIQIPVGDTHIDLIGISCTHKPFVDGPILEQLVSKTAPETLKILLYHTPDLAPVSARCGVDLQLSGHTHGGQVRLPGFGAIFTGSLYGRRYDAGRIQEGNCTLYITRGIGLEGAAAPRVRFLCPPEIIEWDISGENFPA